MLLTTGYLYRIPFFASKHDQSPMSTMKNHGLYFLENTAHLYFKPVMNLFMLVPVQYDIPWKSGLVVYEANILELGIEDAS